MNRNALTELCKERNLSTYGSKIELARRILKAYSWNELLRILFTTDRLEWWQLLFLRPMMESSATRKEILDDEFVSAVFKEIHKTFNSDRGNFLDRKMKFLLRSGLVVRNREGRIFRYLINEPLQPQLKSALTNLKLQRVVQRYQESPEYESFQKYHEPERSIQNTTRESNLEEPELWDPSQSRRVYSNETYVLDELEIIYGIGPATAARFKAAGIDTLAKIVEAGPDGLAKHVGCNASSAQNFYFRAKSTQEKKIIPLKRMESLDENAVFLDIETDLTQSLVWLVGIYFKKTGEFSQFIAHSSRQELKILRQLLTRLNGHSGTIYTFSGTRFDERVLKNRMDEYRMDYSDLPEFEDVYHSIRSSIVFPLKSYSLKSIANFFGYEYRHPDLDGFTVALEYMSNYQRTKDKKLLRRLLEYNEDDIRSLPWMLDKISSVVEKLEVTTETRTTEIQFSC